MIPARDGPAPPARSAARSGARELWLKIHRWLGLALAVIVVALGISGAVLTYPGAFDRMVHPQRYRALDDRAEALASRLLDAGRRQLAAGDRVSAIRYPRGTGGAALVVGEVIAPAPLGLGPPVRTRVWLEPRTTEVLDRSADGADFLWSMHAIHGHLLLDAWGREAVAAAGLLLCVSAISGLWLWWPRLRHLARALRWQRPMSTHMNLHRQTGAILCLVLLIEGATGVYVALPAAFAALLEPGAATRRSAEGPPPERPLAAPRLAIDAVVTLARAAEPAGELEAIFLPTERSPYWVLRLAGDAGPLAAVRVNDGDGTVAPPAPARAPGRAQRVERIVLRLHEGDFGPAWRAIVFLSGVALMLLAITGVILWLEGCRRRARWRP